ncbi:MAG: T9SS type A sorting domain-containing protein [Chitinophagaceae bacterium]
MKKIIVLAFLLLSFFSKKNFAQAYVLGDITAFASFTAMHDSTQCGTTAFDSWAFTVTNSFIGDSIIIKDQNFGTILAFDVNTTGQNPWNTTLNANALIPFVPDDQIANNFANFFGPTIKIISGPDTIYNINPFFQFFVPNPCTYNTITGRVYVDNNNDCSYNAGDVALNAIPVNSTANLSSAAGTYTAYGYTNTGGTYSTKVQESWMTSVNVSIPSFYQFIFPSTTCSPTSYTFTNLPQINADFSLQCTSNVDVQASGSGPINARPNIPFLIHPMVSNTGCDSASGILTLIKDPNTVYNASLSNNPASYVNGDTLKWNYTNLSNLTNGAYWNSYFSSVHLTPSSTVNIGDTLCFTVFSTIPSTDINVANNQFSFCIPVVNSYDPNIKEVSPKGIGANGNIAPTTDLLNYTIHFQNTGTAPAINVYIIDTLSTNVDASSLRIIGASHNMSPQWLSPNVVRFNFNNISLPDSTTNEEHSHGQVRFTIKPKAGLSIGSQIKNKAHIYFDANPAIVTNTALNTIYNPSSVESIYADNILNLYPNPTNTHLNIDFKKPIHSDNVFVEIYTLNGQIVKRASLNSSKMQINVNDLGAGMYFIKIKGDSETYISKFIKE